MPSIRCRVFVVAVMLAAFGALIPADAPAGFSLTKSKETKTNFTSGGQTIEVWQFTPAEGKGPFPGVVLLHGMDGLDELPKVQLLYKLVAGKIAEKGFIVHFVLYFQRTPTAPKDVGPLKDALKAGLVGQGDKKPDEKVEKLYRAWMETVQHGVKNLRETKDVDRERIGIVGLSMGGFLGTSLVVDDPELKALALVNVFGGLPQQQSAQVRKSKPKLPPILVMGGEEDDIVPMQVQLDLYDLWRASGGKGEAHFYGKVGHAFFDKERGAIDQDLAMNEALPTAIRFLKRHLQVKPPEKTP